ncbi:MAG TPA: Mur ligase family protein [Woeseiaceae bacterium]|nr:Mur ligase family protein [Woeseiaceae bacterium]
MRFLDARRLTGPSLIFDGPGTVLDVACTPDEADGLLPAWKQHVLRMVAALGWATPQFASRKLQGGISMAFSAPIDALYAATEINEWAWSASAAELHVPVEVPDFDATVAALRASIAEEANPQLMAMIHAAKSHGTSLLWDDDEVSLGLGRGSETWPVRELPDTVHWDRYMDVPVGIVTGTNGKTTTVRMALHIAQLAGDNVGLCSTDWIAVNNDIIERGDWSGPGGARKVLRQQNVDVAILEAARGGLLRRGLGVDRADAALITNVTEDHLGDFGTQSLDELLDIKWIVSRAVRRSGRLILNADDARLREKATEFGGSMAWFSLDMENDFVQQQIDLGNAVYALQGVELIRVEDGVSENICSSVDIPVTLGGHARHNVANALAASALTASLGYPIDAIRNGLTSMDQGDNPGRCNLYTLGGVNVLVDFAHNPAAMQALFSMAKAVPARRRVLCFGQAGDRTDGLIREMTRNAWAIGLDRVIISELADYYRGRGRGDVFALMQDELMRCGADASQVLHVELEIEALVAALEWAEAGDLVIMLALASGDRVQQHLRELGAR